MENLLKRKKKGKTVFSLKSTEKKPRLFSALFEQLTPEEFIFTFHSDNAQTLAYMLSYAHASYCRKVIKLMKDETTLKMLVMAIRDMKCSQRTKVTEFDREMEKAALECAKELCS